MALTNPFSIKYGDQTVGGSSDTYQLHGPYVIDKGYDSLRLVFDVVVVASSYATLQSLSEDLEDAFRVRLEAGDTLVVTLSGSSWTYTMGTTLLNAVSTIAKSGNPETDIGYSRAYTCSVEAELPADADAGLRDVEVLVDFEAGRQQSVTMRGTYTATTAGDAVARYQADFDAEATTYLTAADSSATWELVDENYTLDRQKSSSNTPASHLCNFTRTYLELLVNQSQASLDDTDIRDHRVTFTNLSQHPGDSKENTSRLRRVVGNYDCAVDIDQTTNLQNVYDNKIRSHVRQLFQTNFSPQIYGVEEERASYDESSKRLSVSLQFIYQTNDGEALVELAQGVAYREARSIDYTFTHAPDEFSAEADVGFAIAERVWTRLAIVVGTESPKTRILAGPTEGDAGLFRDVIGGLTGPDQGNRQGVRSDGWNIVANQSQVTPRYLGGPNDTQIRVAVLSESVTERFHRKPGSRTSASFGSPITGGG